MVALEATVDIGKRAGADAAHLWQVLAAESDTSGRVVVNAQRLAQRLGGGERSIFRQLAALAQAGALRKLGRTHGGAEYAVSYADQSFSDFGRDANGGGVSLQSAALILGQACRPHAWPPGTPSSPNPPGGAGRAG